jgi:hypothetical protein
MLYVDYDLKKPGFRQILMLYFGRRLAVSILIIYLYGFPIVQLHLFGYLSILSIGFLSL